MCGGVALGGLRVVFLEEDVAMFVGASVTAAKFSEEADFIDDVVEKEELKGARFGGVAGLRIETYDCLKKLIWLWRVNRRCSVYAETELYRKAEKRWSEDMVRTEVMGAERA